MLLEKIEGLEGDEDDVQVEVMEKTLQTQLNKYCFKNSIVKELQTLYMQDYIDAWLISRDKCHHLLGFEDCVYNFDASPPGYREGTTADMVTMSTGFTKH